MKSKENVELVSVIVPTYKRNDYILRAIESIIMQDYPSLEIVVVDDNGKGKPEQIETQIKLEKYISGGFVKYIVNEVNVGGALARNNGIIGSSGEYITFLDDDDVYLPGKIAIQVEAMKTNDLDLCVMDGETVDENGVLLSKKIQPIDNGFDRNQLIRAHIVHHITGTNVFMYKRKSLIDIGMFDDIPAGQEFMLMQKSIVNNLKIGCVHETLVQFHMDGQERISTRLNKIPGLKIVYEEKKKYFYLLTKNEISSVKSKHHGTMFYMYYVNGKIWLAIVELLKSVCCSPSFAYKTFVERKGKLKRK